MISVVIITELLVEYTTALAKLTAGILPRRRGDTDVIRIGGFSLRFPSRSTPVPDFSSHLVDFWSAQTQRSQISILCVSPELSRRLWLCFEETFSRFCVDYLIRALYNCIELLLETIVLINLPAFLNFEISVFCICRERDEEMMFFLASLFSSDKTHLSV